MKYFSMLFLLAIPFLLQANPGMAQDSAAMVLTVNQAVEYAQQNHVLAKNAMLDEQSARHKVKEITGLGLPQISGSFDLKDYWEVPTVLVPGDNFGGPPGSLLPFQFGIRVNAAAGFEASQLLFSNDYLVGLKATKVVYELMQKATEKTLLEISASVRKAYYTVLVSRERVKLLDANIERIARLKEDTRLLLENGFAEQIDFDRITIVHSNLVEEKEKVGRFLDLGMALLKFQMGLGNSVKLELADRLSDMKFEMPELSLQGFDYQKRPEYALMDSQRKGAELELKRDRGSYLPNAALYGAIQGQTFAFKKSDIFDTSRGWYPLGLFGFRVGLPVFDGFQKQHKIAQAKLGLVKANNNLEFMKSSIDVEIAGARTQLLNSGTSLNTQKKNMELAKGVYETSKKKYEEGIGSYLEVLNAETSLKEAQTNYISALYDAVIANIDYSKATGTLK